MAAPTLVATIPGGLAGSAANWDSATSSPSTRTTAPFNVTAGDVIVVDVGSEDGITIFGTPSGGGLTWVQQAQLGTAGANCRAAMFTATATATTSITVSITATWASGVSWLWGFRVYQFAAGASIGAVASSASGSTVAPSQAITTTQDNSALVYGGFDWTATDGSTRAWRAVNGIAPTSGNGLEKDYFRDTGGAHYAAYTGLWDDVGAIGSKTVGLTTPTQKATIVVLEIKGSAGPPARFDPSYLDWPLRSGNPKLGRHL
jgi:hypothetical protein